MCPVGVTTQDPELERRLDPAVGARWMTNYLKALTMELTAIARACGKSDVHHLEPDDLVALIVEAAAMAKVPLAGTDWIPGQQQGSGFGRAVCNRLRCEESARRSLAHAI